MSIAQITSGYISRKELAKQLGQRLRGRPYSEWTLITWEREAKGPPVTRVGRQVLYRLEAVERWLNTQEANTVERA